jgi:Mannosyl-glycoprotein endo-beta-N-acetylglucosaminidase
MTRRPLHYIAALVAVLGALAPLAGLVATAPGAAAAVTTQTPVMGPSLLSAAQLAAWYHRHSGVTPKIPAFGGHPAGDVAALAQVFIDDGKLEGVRGDIAFVQSQLETGWLGFIASQVPPDAYNYAGIHAFDGRTSLPNCLHGDSVPSRCMGTPQHGVLVQIQLLRSYADPSAKTASGRFISAPSDRAGQAPLWEYFGGNNCPCGHLIWASASGYGVRVIQMYSQALAESGMAGACVPYAPAAPGPTSGTGYWDVTRDSIVHQFGDAKFLGDTRHLALRKPLTGGESLSTGKGYWLLGRDGGIFSYGAAHFYGSTGGLVLNKPVNGMERTANNGGYWLVADDGGIFAYGNAQFRGSMGGRRLNKPVLGMERTASGKGYWLFAADGGIFSFGDAHFYGSLGGRKLSVPVVSMQRTATGHGYWMMAANGRVFAFGDAHNYGDIAACKNYGGGARMLVTPNGGGYWIASGSGVIQAFGDAKKLGFPATVGGPTIALLATK